MAATTKIAWAHATPNFWIGCTQVSDACKNCYAIPIADRMGIGWGDDALRHRTSDEQWRAPLRWNAMHDRGQTHMVVQGESLPVPLWVFGNSMSDFFDNHQDVAAWRKEAWTKVVRPTPLLRWIFSTKRIPNVLRTLPADWDGGRNYRHVGIIASIGDQGELDRDVPRLVALKAHGVRWVGLSIEPELGPISIIGCSEARQLDWVICGGESTQLFPARKYDIAWARTLIAQCRTLDIPFFLKQLGSNAFDGARRIHTKDRAGANPDEWPADLRVQQWPRVFENEERPISQPTLL